MTIIAPLIVANMMTRQIRDESRLNNIKRVEYCDDDGLTTINGNIITRAYLQDLLSDKSRIGVLESILKQKGQNAKI